MAVSEELAEKTLRPVADFPRAARARVRAVLTDIDDTLTSDGRLPAVAYAALEKLRDAGLLVVPVTGRPAGWCDLIARQWPVDAVVGENGAFYFRYDDKARKMIRRYVKSAEARGADRAPPRVRRPERESVTEDAPMLEDADTEWNGPVPSFLGQGFGS